MNREAPRYRISIRQHARPVPFRGEVLRSLVRRALRFLGGPAADLRILVVAGGGMERGKREVCEVADKSLLSFPPGAGIRWRAVRPPSHGRG